LPTTVTAKACSSLEVPKVNMLSENLTKIKENAKKFCLIRKFIANLFLVVKNMKKI
jgi:hypothetical protein